MWSVAFSSGPCSSIVRRAEGILEDMHCSQARVKFMCHTQTELFRRTAATSGTLLVSLSSAYDHYPLNLSPSLRLFTAQQNLQRLYLDCNPFKKIRWREYHPKLHTHSLWVFRANSIQSARLRRTVVGVLAIVQDVLMTIHNDTPDAQHLRQLDQVARGPTILLQ